jgi:16S rRNA (cytosine1402-N4)-methyltransferase
VEGPLDLRLNPERGISAADFIAQLGSEESLIKLLVKHSEETYAKAIAKVVYADRKKMTTTKALANAVRLALSPLDKTEKEVEKSIKRTFQAIRIAINDEFSALETFLRNLPQCLKSQGRVAILTFHAGEDTRVELALKKGLEQGLFSSISTEAIRPTPKEMFDNPRSKSARLRWAVRA